MTDRISIRAEEGLEISAAIQPMLRGIGPDLQGIVLADLVSLFFAGHHPATREEAIELWIKCMRTLIPASEMQIFENIGGKPDGWEKQ